MARKKVHPAVHPASEAGPPAGPPSDDEQNGGGAEAMDEEASAQEKPRGDARERNQWTLKHRALDHEFRNLVGMAAKKQGMQLMDYVVETLRARSMDVVTGSGPPASPPARPEDIVDLVKMMRQEQTEAVERLRQEQAERDRQQAEAAERARQEQAERLEKLEQALIERQGGGGLVQGDRTTVELIEKFEREMADRRAEEQRLARRGRWRR